MVVCRLLLGFIGGIGGVGAPLARLAPAGNPMVGTFDVVETKVGSDIWDLSTTLLWEPRLCCVATEPETGGFRCGRGYCMGGPPYPPAAGVDDVDEFSRIGGVALAE